MNKIKGIDNNMKTFVVVLIILSLLLLWLFFAIMIIGIIIDMIEEIKK